MSDGVLNPPCYGKWYAATQLVTGVLDETVPTTAVFGEKLDFINSFGSYDPFFLDRPDTRSVLQGVSIHVDCDNKRLYTTNGKVPFVQIYDLENQSLIHRRSEEHTSELQSRGHLVCRLLLEKKN